MNTVLIVLISILVGAGLWSLISGTTTDTKDDLEGYELERVVQGTWELEWSDGVTENKLCSYSIYFNKSTQHYKLKCSGHDPENHKMYFYLQNEIINLNKSLKS